MEPFPYVYIDAEGTARELHAAERACLEKRFKGGDGAMPYVKSTYEERDGWGELSGYLLRGELPAGTAIGHAPRKDPNRPITRADFVTWLRSKGVDVTENDDGSMTVARPQR